MPGWPAAWVKPIALSASFRVLEKVVLAAAPDGAVAVLVAGVMVDDRHHQGALRVGGVGISDMAGAADVERAVGRRAAVEHQAVEVGVGGVAAELAHLGPARPDILTARPVQECARRMLRQGVPETDLLGPRGHIVAVGVVGVGDPERRGRVVGRDQDILGALALVGLMSQGQVRRNTGFSVGMALGQDPQVVDELVAVLHGVFQEEAVTDGVVGHVVLHPHVIGAVHRHAAAVGVVDRRSSRCTGPGLRPGCASGSDSGPGACSGPSGSIRCLRRTSWTRPSP